MKTKCAIIRELNKPLDVDFIEVPSLQHGQVLVKVHYGGLCGAQLNEISGLKGEDKYLPHLLGHEGFGTVLEVGHGVTKVKRDDRVILTWIIGGGLEGGSKKYGDCNAGSITTFQEYSVISENRLVLCPSFSYIDAPRLAMFGCMIPTGCGTVLYLAEGNSIRVFGAGNIGTAVVLAARACKKHKVYAVDISEEKLKAISRFGAIVNLPTDDLEKVDTAIDTTGNVKVIEQAFASIKDNGTLIILGNSSVGSVVSFNPFDFIKGKKVIGSWGGGCSPDIHIPYLMHTIDVSDISVKVFSLDNINNAIEEFRKGSCDKILVGC